MTSGEVKALRSSPSYLLIFWSFLYGAPGQLSLSPGYNYNIIIIIMIMIMLLLLWLGTSRSRFLIYSGSILEKQKKFQNYYDYEDYNDYYMYRHNYDYTSHVPCTGLVIGVLSPVLLPPASLPALQQPHVRRVQPSLTRKDNVRQDNVWHQDKIQRLELNEQSPTVNRGDNGLMCKRFEWSNFNSFP